MKGIKQTEKRLRMPNMTMPLAGGIISCTDAVRKKRDKIGARTFTTTHCRKGRGSKLSVC